jgi:hypothetical protein
MREDVFMGRNSRRNPVAVLAVAAGGLLATALAQAPCGVKGQ